MYIIHKSTRLAGKTSYTGPTWDQAGIRHMYKEVYHNKDEADGVAKILSEHNPVGFRVSEID